MVKLKKIGVIEVEGALPERRSADRRIAPNRTLIGHELSPEA